MGDGRCSLAGTPNQHRVVERMTAHYGGRQAEGVYLVPANVNLDCVDNFPEGSGP